MNADNKEIYEKYEQALRNLNDRAWPNLLPNEKIEVLQAIENKIALDNNRIPAEVVAAQCEPGSVAMQVDNTILIDETELSKPDFMHNVESLYHEASHITDFQASIFSELRQQIGVDEFELRNTPIPDYRTDFEGYYNHPAENAARQAGEVGVQRTIADQLQIAAVDQTMHCSGNQVLVTYDYLALDYDNGVNPESVSQCDVSISECVEMSGPDYD